MIMRTTITAVSVHVLAVSCLDWFRLVLSIVNERGPVCVCDLNTMRHNSIYSSLFSLFFGGILLPLLCCLIVLFIVEFDTKGIF